MFCVSCSTEITDSQLESAKNIVENISIYISEDFENSKYIIDGTLANFSDGNATIDESLIGTAKNVREIKEAIVEVVNDEIKRYGSNFHNIFDDIGTTKIDAYYNTDSTATNASSSIYLSWNSGTISTPTIVRRKNYYKFVITLVAGDKYKFSYEQDKTVTIYITVKYISKSE